MDIEIINQIHQTPFKFFCAITGGGQGFISDFCKIEGASNNFIGAIVPYNQIIFDNFIGGKSPDTYVSSEGARKLAVAAFSQCLKAGIERKNAIGIGASSSLAKQDERKNRKHKIYVAVHSYTFTLLIEVILNQGRRNRNEEDNMVANLIGQALAFATIKRPITSKQYVISEDEGEFFKIYKENDKNLGYLINNETDLISSDNLAPLKQICVFAGSFNPLHDGHREIIALSKEITGQPIFLELTVNNADKGFLDFIELEKRIENLTEYQFILTNLPTIKSKIDSIRKYAPMAEITFIVGSDTWERIWNPKYGYEPDFLEEFFIKNKVKFLMFKRGGHELKEIPYGKNLLISHNLNKNFQTKIISSTEIRKKQYETT